jgi:hypothetical protein
MPGQVAPVAPQPVPQVQSAGSDPSFAGAITALIRALASQWAPKGITQRKAAVNEAVEPPAGSLGNQFSPQ